MAQNRWAQAQVAPSIRSLRNSSRMVWLRGALALLLSLTLTLSACASTSTIKPRYLSPLHLPGVTYLSKVSAYVLQHQELQNPYNWLVATPSWSSQPLLLITDYHSSNDPNQEDYLEAQTVGLDGRDAHQIRLGDTCDDLALAYQQKYLLCNSISTSALKALPFAPPGQPTAKPLTLLNNTTSPPYNGGHSMAWNQARAELAVIQNTCAFILYASPSATTPTPLHLVATLGLDPVMAQLKLNTCHVIDATWSSDGRYLLFSVEDFPIHVMAVNITKLLASKPSTVAATPSAIPITQAYQIATTELMEPFAVSPSAPVVAYVGTVDDTGTSYSIWLHDLRTGKDRHILSISPYDGSLYEYICQLAWGPDGRSLIFGVCGNPYVGACTGDCLPDIVLEGIYTVTLPAASIA